MLKIIDDVPQENQYCFSLKIQNLILGTLKSVLRPRYEEQFNLVERWEKRITWELGNLTNDQLKQFTELEDEESKIDVKERHGVLKLLFATLSEQVSKDSNFELC